MVAFLLCVRAGVTGKPLGVLINKQNLMSLSRFQTAVWMIIILSILVVIVSIRIQSGVSDVLNIKFSIDLLQLFGISAVALVGSPLIESTKKSRNPNEKVAPQTAAALRKSAMVPASQVDQDKAEVKAQQGGGANAGTSVKDSQPEAGQDKTKTDPLAKTITDNAQGLLYKNPSISDARFSDLFRGSEVGNFGQVSLAKVQMFFLLWWWVAPTCIPRPVFSPARKLAAQVFQCPI
jgi:hypothetical protein